MLDHCSVVLAAWCTHCVCLCMCRWNNGFNMPSPFLILGFVLQIQHNAPGFPISYKHWFIIRPSSHPLTASKMGINSLIISLAVILGLASSFANAATFASNVTSTTVAKNSATLSWLAPDSLAAVLSYLLTVEDESVTVVFNVSITDVSATSYEVTGLAFSTYHNATLATVDTSGGVIGSDSHYFLTEYDPVNINALCAIAVVGALVLILVIVKAAGIVCNPDKEAEKWKREILVTKQREREERKKKLSAQPLGGSQDLAWLINIDKLLHFMYFPCQAVNASLNQYDQSSNVVASSYSALHVKLWEYLNMCNFQTLIFCILYRPASSSWCTSIECDVTELFLLIIVGYFFHYSLLNQLSERFKYNRATAIGILEIFLASVQPDQLSKPFKYCMQENSHSWIIVNMLHSQLSNIEC